MVAAAKKRKCFSEDGARKLSYFQRCNQSLLRFLRVATMYAILRCQWHVEGYLSTEQVATVALAL
jgi:hypothetical protein